MNRWECGLWLAVFWVTACGPSPAPSPPPTHVAKSDTPTLFDQLHALGREEPPLSGVPQWGRQMLDQLVGSLSEAAREELRRGEHPEALRRPLLHWAAGGNSLSVYASAVETSALSDDWTDLAARNNPPPSSRELVQIGNELVRRAAHHLLRERAADFAAGRTPDPVVLRQVATTARLLGHGDLERSATVAWAAHGGGAEATYALFRLHARALEAAPAETALAALEQDPEASSLAPSAKAELAAVRVLTSESGDPLQRARASLLLARHEEARRTLLGATKPGLVHATLVARADLDGSRCPGVMRPNAILCRAAFTVRAGEIDLVRRLETAWTSGVDRDAEAVEHYLGLVFVMPLMLQHAHDGHALSHDEFVSTLEALSAHATSAQGVAPHFEAVALLADALSEAVRGSGTTDVRPVVAAEKRTELRRRGIELAHRTNDAWSESTALATFALSLQDDPLGPDLEALEVEAGPSLPTLGAIELWTALADRDQERLGRIDSIVVRIAEQAAPEARTGWLLSYAEARAALVSSPEAKDVLERLCRPLLVDTVPLSLRLRAAFDLASVQAGTGRRKDALRLVSDTLDAVPFEQVDSATTRDLWVMLAGYRAILPHRDGAAAAKQASSVLVELVRSLDAPGSASPSVAAWLAWWQAELSAMEAEVACEKRRPCLVEVEKRRAEARAKLEQLGPRTRALLESGTLPLGGALIDLGYDASIGLEPRVGVELAFPLVEVPGLRK